MNCAACQHENPDGSAFCEECGARFERRCPACGSNCTPAAKFCRSCGIALAGSISERADGGVACKVVTIVFADLIGSTALHERVGAESVRRVMERYYRALRGAIDAQAGTLVKLLGDGVMAAFGVPRFAELCAERERRSRRG
jgi:adenylate cyclase